MTQSTAARNEDHDIWFGRIEDDPLLRGQGRFGDDVKPEGALVAFFVRSPHAFAKIARIDVSAVESAPGVVAVLTASNLRDAHYHSISHGHPIPGRGGKTAVSPHRPSLAETRVMHVGEPVAMVVAKSAAVAQDAADKIVVEYESLTPVTDAREAIEQAAPQLWPEAPGNIGFDWTAPAEEPAISRVGRAHVYGDGGIGGRGASPPEADDALAAGARVRHPLWGMGTVRLSEGRGERQKVVVHFASVGMKKLLVHQARLERV